ncbi:MAG TPA: WecB/TagA/CpsF family glycosyltransferase [Chitinophagaceae bacterium]|nr:WecB/TagA/CpsF family glycosyltransferase [Chitinophagaceae bacterium]
MRSSIKILGNRIDCFKSFENLYQHIIGNYRGGMPARGYITVNNVHTMMEGFWNPSFQKIINEAYLSIPDGKPLEVVGKLKGNKDISRLFGPTVMEKFIDWGRNDGIRHFFLGSSEATLAKLKEAIDSKYPNAIIAGMISPPYKPLDQWDHDGLIQTINAAKPDFIWIGLGAPKQEKWMFEHYEKLEQGMLFGIGAGFDYLAGNTSHAPTWMKRSSLEWLYRLIQEPRRLWKRYFKTIPPFIFYASLELMGIKVKKEK